MNDFVRDLVKIGFSHKEASVYIILLGLGRASASQIIKKTTINRASVYRVLDSMRKKGLILSEETLSDKYYIPEPPERILTLLQMQSMEVEERRKRADILVMRLKVIHNSSGNKPNIRYIESISGLRMMQREYENYPEDILQVIGYDAFLALHDPSITKEHRSELSNSSRKIRSIIISTKTVQIENLNGLEYIVLPPELASIDGEMTVCGDRLVMFSYANGIIAIEIKSKTLADTARATLELAWNEAKRIGEVRR